MKKPANRAPAPRKAPQFFSAEMISRATGASKRNIHRTAKRLGWKMHQRGNLFEYQVPKLLRSKCLAVYLASERAGLGSFRIGLERRAEVDRAQHRFNAICALEAELLSGPHEAALDQVSAAFHVNKISLRQWVSRWEKAGFSGLLESKRGNSGRKPKAIR